MPKMVVNTDAYTVSVPNQAPNQPPVARAYRRGEVFDATDEEARRGSSITVRNHYTVGTVTVPRDEPALLPAAESSTHAAAAANAVAEARTEALLRELAAVSSGLPPERLAQIAENVMPAAEEGVPTVDAGESPDTGGGTPVVTTRPDESPAASPAPPAPPAAGDQPSAPPPPPPPPSAPSAEPAPAPGETRRRSGPR